MSRTQRASDKDHILLLLKGSDTLSWERVWDENADLQDTFARANPNILFTGDRRARGDCLVIPEPDAATFTVGTETHKKITRLRTKLFLRLRLLLDDFTALKDTPYELEIEGETEPRSGTTDGNGQIEEEVPLDVQTAVLAVRVKFEESNDPNLPDPAPETGLVRGEVPLVWELQIGALNPVCEEAPDRNCISGVQQRLNNLNLNCGPVDGILGPNTRAAIGAFQKIFGLDEDCEPNNATQAKLVDVHDKLDSILGPKP